MQTFSLSKEELQDLGLYEYLKNKYIVTVVCKRINIDVKNGVVKYDLQKGELTYEPADKQPKPEDKPNKETTP